MPGQKREARLRARYPGHPRLKARHREDVDGRDVPGHDESGWARVLGTMKAHRRGNALAPFLRLFSLWRGRPPRLRQRSVLDSALPQTGRVGLSESGRIGLTHAGRTGRTLQARRLLQRLSLLRKRLWLSWRSRLSGLQLRSRLSRRARPVRQSALLR